MIGVDVGGTFTDVVAIRNGEIIVNKVPSQSERAYEAVLAGAEGVGVAQSRLFNHASTHGLNAIITRRLPKVALLHTKGHRDVLDQGRIIRPAEAITDPSWRRSFSDAARPLVPRYLRRGVQERLDRRGEAVIPLDEAQLHEQLGVLARCDVEGVAICLLHSYVSDVHEQRVRELVRDVLGDIPVSVSCETSPLAREYARTSTTVVDVMMKLIYGEYNEHLLKGLAELGFNGQLNYADSAATLIDADAAMAKPYRVVFSGPAAGTAACVRLGEATGLSELICADIGGTSCDISLITQGRPYLKTTFEFEHDLLVNSLSTDIVTIGAGGGSLVGINPLGELTVGPGSAGATPGPACYGAGGNQPTTTDACLLMGFLDPDAFLGGAHQLHPDLAAHAFTSLNMDGPLSKRIRDAWNLGLNNIAEGVFNAALTRGVDPSDYSLVAYGAAGPMMLPSLLDLLHVKRVIVPPHPGLFSALGLLSTDLVYSDSRSAYTVLREESVPSINDILTSLESNLLEPLAEEDRARAEVVRSFDARLLGQSWDTPFVSIPAGDVTVASLQALVQAFHDEYQQRNGTRFESFPVEAVTFRVQIKVPSEKFEFSSASVRGGSPLEPSGVTTIRHLYDEEVACLVYARADLRAGDSFDGPAVVREEMSTTFVPRGRALSVGKIGELLIE